MPKTCKECGESKAYRRFRREVRSGSGPDAYADVCYTCSQAKDTEILKSANKERKTEKEISAEMKKLRKKQAQDRIAHRKQYKKTKKIINEQEKELARRILAKKKLVHFIKRFHPNYQAGWVHHDICRRLEKFMKNVEAGLSPRLMLFMPPRHGKSEIASNYFPSWALGHHPEFEIIASSYAVSLPIGFSRKVRSRIQDPAFKAMFSRTTLSKDSKSAEAWMTTQGGGYVAAGVGGGITGKGAHILIIDDPIKDAQEADSETVRDGVWDWYGSTAYTRLAPGGGVLVIQTRWHDDDLSGRLITQMKDLRDDDVPEDEIDKWEIIEYPAIAVAEEWLNRDGTITEEAKYGNSIQLRQVGDALHTARFPIDRLKSIKRSLQPRHWSALYQQNPVPDEGEYFTKDMFRMSHSPPPLSTLKVFIAGDLAIGENQQNDFTVFAVCGLDEHDQLYVLDIIRFKGDTYKIVETLLDLTQKYDPFLVGLEKGQLEHAIKPVLKKRMRERRIYPTLAEKDKALVPVSDKMVRARPLQGRMQQGMVYFHSTQPWFEVAQHELMRFPGGVHDDIVDALAWAVRMIIREEPPRPKKQKRVKSWRDKLKAHVVGGSDVDPMAA